MKLDCLILQQHSFFLTENLKLGKPPSLEMLVRLVCVDGHTRVFAKELVAYLRKVLFWPYLYH